MPDDLKEERRLTISQLAKRLRMSARRIRAYYRVGIFPQPIREPGEKGGYWLPWAVAFMEQRRDRTHEFRIPKELRAIIEQKMEQSPPRRRPRRADKQTKLDRGTQDS